MHNAKQIAKAFIPQLEKRLGEGLELNLMLTKAIAYTLKNLKHSPAIEDLKNGKTEKTLLALGELKQKFTTQQKKQKAAEACLHSAVFLILNDEAEALEQMKEAVTLAPNNLENWVFFGVLCEKAGDIENAQNALEKVFQPEHSFDFKRGINIKNLRALLNLRKNNLLTAKAYISLSDISKKAGDLMAAAERLCFAVNEFEKRELTAETAAAYQRLGIIYRAAGNSDVAEDMHKAAFALYSEINRRDGMADSLGNLGMSLGVREDFLSALENHRKSLVLNLKLKRETAIADQFINLGIIHHMKGDFASAERSFRSGIKHYIKLENNLGIARTCSYLAAVYEAADYNEHACLMNRHAILLFEEEGDMRNAAECHTNLGRLYLNSGDTNASEYHLLRAIYLEEKNGNKHNLANALGNLGLLYLEAKRLNEAEAMFRKSLNLELQTRRLLCIGADYGNLGMVEKLKGEVEKACRYWFKAMKYFEEAGAEKSANKMRGEIESAIGRSINGIDWL